MIRAPIHVQRVGFLRVPALEQTHYNHDDELDELGGDLVDTPPARLHSIEDEADAQALQAEWDLLFGEHPAPSAAHPTHAGVTADATPVCPDAGRRLPSHGDVEDGEEPFRPPTRRPIIVTVERQQRRFEPPPPPTLYVDSLLSRSRWPTVVHQRYREATPVPCYVERARELLSQCVSMLETACIDEAGVRQKLSVLHSDALLILIEELNHTLRRPTLSPEEEALSEHLLHILWHTLASPEGGRVVELSSKQVVWASQLFDASSISVVAYRRGERVSLLPPSHLYSLIYPNRKQLRRWQNAACLRVLLRYPPPPRVEGTVRRAATTSSDVLLYAACVSHGVARQLERSAPRPTAEEVEERTVALDVVQAAVTFVWHYLDDSVRQAALRALLSRRRTESGRGRRSRSLPAYLDGCQRGAALPPRTVFERMDERMTATDGFAVPLFEKRLVLALMGHSLPRGSPPDALLSQREALPSSPSANVPPSTSEGVEQGLQLLGSRPPLHTVALCEEYLTIVAEVYTVVLALTDLRTALALAPRVLRHFPPLASPLLERTLALAMCPGAHEAVDEESTADLDRPILAAVSQLLAHVNLLEVVDRALVELGGGTMQDAALVADGAPWPARGSAALAEGVLRGLTYHVPQALVPVILVRTARQREVATWPLSARAVRLLDKLVRSMPGESLGGEVVRACQLLVCEERRKAVVFGDNAEMADSLARLDRSCIARVRRETSDALVRVGAGAGGAPVAAAPSHAAAIHELFGHSAADERSVAAPEVVATCQSALAWLYQIYRMSCQLWYEVRVLTEFAVAQGQQRRLQISTLGQRLVALSERAAAVDVLEGDSEAVELMAWIDACVAPQTAAPPRPAALLPQTTSTSPAAHASVPGVRAPTREAATYVESLTREASWRCLSFYLNAALVEQTRERPDPLYPARAQAELRAQLSLGEAGGLVVSYFFHDDADDCAREGSARSAELSERTHAALLYLNLFREFLQTQSVANAPYNTLALRSWARSATCLCLMHMLSQEQSKTLGLEDVLCVYRHMLLMVAEDDAAEAERAQGGSGASSALPVPALVRFPPPLPSLPPRLHEQVFTSICADAHLWREAVPLLELAMRSGTAASARLPASVYRTVMRTCLMHRVAVPDFLRARARAEPEGRRSTAVALPS